MNTFSKLKAKVLGYLEKKPVLSIIVIALVAANIATFSSLVVHSNTDSAVLGVNNEGSPKLLAISAIEALQERAKLKSPKPTKAPKATKVPKVKATPTPSPSPWPTDESAYQEYYLSDIAWVSATNREGQGPVEKDKSNKDEQPGGNTITLNGVKYNKGLGVHASSKIIYNIKGQCSRFNSIVGLDDEAGPLGSVVFVLNADKAKIGETGIMRGNTPSYAMYKDIPPGTQTLELQVKTADGPPGFTYSDDHADWADAKIKCLKGAFGVGTPPGTEVSSIIHPDLYSAVLEYDPTTKKVTQKDVFKTEGDLGSYSSKKPIIDPKFFIYKVKVVSKDNLRMVQGWNKQLISSILIDGIYRFQVSTLYKQDATLKLYDENNKLIWSGKIY